ncbi:hypothetical protein TgHK011_000046 [Trichoderma gracile]|nr:hypothetical protein TgHK011_000046 [Trichoderma gracile]
MTKNEMTKSAASHIQSTQAKGGKDMSSSGFSARAQSAAAHNENVSRGTTSGGDYGGNSGNQSQSKK